jgi:tRNA A-37 threonylcarbamoyl transferase component Bud32
MPEREEAPVIQCPTCKATLESGVRFCPHDGTPLTDTAAYSGAPTPTTVRNRPPELQLPILLENRYNLVELLGGGGMAKVYKAVDKRFGRDVAVKVINPELRGDPEFDARFQREAQIASKLADPYIVVVHDFGVDAQLGPFLVMEYLQGRSLRQWLQQEGRLPVKAALQVAGQMFLALLHAHSKDIVHRDIKPDNVFLLEQTGVGRIHIRVLDFGIARIVRRDEGTGGPTLTSAGAVLGTPRYMSPEQLAGQPLDTRSDIYSAALVLYEALTGHLPFQSGKKKLTELCPELQDSMQELLEQCLRPDREERPPTALEVYLRLQELGKASGVLLMPPGAMDRLVQSYREKQGAATLQPPTVTYPGPGSRKPVITRRRLLLAGGLTLLLAGLGTGAWFLWHPGPPLAKAGDPETLNGVKCGDRLGEVAKNLDLKRLAAGNPWANKPHPGKPQPGKLIGHILDKKFLGVPDSDLEHILIYGTEDEKLVVLALNDDVLAVIARRGHRAGTGRGVFLSGTVNQIFHNYYDVMDLKTEPLPTGPEDDKETRNLRLILSPSLGIGFEVSGDDIRSITLFPPVKP